MRLTRFLSIIVIVCIFTCSAIAEQTTIDLSTLTIAELDALSEQIRQEKKAATTIDRDIEVLLKNDFKSQIESLMPEGTSFSYPFFGLDISRERELYTVSGSVGCKKPDKTKVNLNNATIHYWFDGKLKKYCLVAIYTKEDIYFVDADNLANIERYLDKTVITRLYNSAQSQGTSLLTGLPDKISPTSTPSPEPTVTQTPTIKPTAVPTITPSPQPTPNIGQVSSDTLTLRAEPSRYSKALSGLVKGASLIIIDQIYSNDEYWFLVDYPVKNLRGYVLSEYISSNINTIQAAVPTSTVFISRSSYSDFEPAAQHQSIRNLSSINFKTFKSENGVCFGMTLDEVISTEKRKGNSPSSDTAYEGENYYILSYYSNTPLLGGIDYTWMEYCFTKRSKTLCQYYYCAHRVKNYAFIESKLSKQYGAPLYRNERPHYGSAKYISNNYYSQPVSTSHWQIPQKDFDVIIDLILNSDDSVYIIFSYIDHDEYYLPPISSNNEFTDYQTPRSGERGEQVTSIQQQLMGYGYYSGNLSGIYDSKTMQAVKNFQINNGIRETGYCNLETWVLLSSKNAVYETTVYRSRSGSVYHSYSTCSGMETAIELNLSDAIRRGLRPCEHCH